MTQLRLPEVNVVIVAGRLTADPDFRTTSGGTLVGNLSLAVNRRVKNKQGEWTDDPAFLDVVVWSELAERCQSRLKKGSPVLVNGTLRSRRWETKDGQKRTSIEIVANRLQMLEKAPAAGASSDESQEDAGGKAESSSDEVPF